MMAFLGTVAVGCIALIAYIVSTAATFGFVEILGVAIFGFVAAVSMLAFAAIAMAKYTGNKVKKGVSNIRYKVKKLSK